MVSAVFAVATVVFGFTGFLDPDIEESEFPNSLFRSFGFLFFDGFNQAVANPWIHASRICALLFASNSVTAIVYSAIGNQLRILRIRNPIIVIGTGWRGRKIIDMRLKSSPKEREIIVVDRAFDPVYETWCRSKGMGIVKGDAMLRKTLEKAKVLKAKEIYVFCRDDETEMQVAHQMHEMLLEESVSEAVHCYLEFASSSNANILHEIIPCHSKLKPRILNVEATTVRLLLSQHPIDNFGSSPGASVLHAIVFGSSSIAKELIFQLMQVGHFEEGKRIHLSVVVDDSVQAKKDFLSAYPAFHENGSGIEPKDDWVSAAHILPSITFVEVDLTHVNVVDWESLLPGIVEPQILKGESQITAIFAATGEGAGSSLFASSVMPSLQALLGPDSQMQFYFYVPTGDSSFTKAMTDVVTPQGIDAVRFKCVGFEDFMSSQSITEIQGDHVEALAKKLHWTYMGGSNSEEDEWIKAAPVHQESSRRAGMHAKFKKRIFVRLNLSDLADDKLAEVEHRRWCAEQLLRGVRPLVDFPSARQNRTQPYSLSPEDRKKICQWFGWESEPVSKPEFCNRRFHLDLMPFEEIVEVIGAVGTKEARKQAKKELKKDHKQVDVIEEFWPLL